MPLPPQVNSSSPSRAYYADHNRKMSQIAGGKGAHLNDYVSPYSVLRGSTEGDVDNMIGNLQSSSNTSGLVMRSNRTQLLRQLALKQKFE